MNLSDKAHLRESARRGECTPEYAERLISEAAPCRYLIQETTDGNCPAGLWAELQARSWEDACALHTGIPAIEWRYTSQALIELAMGHRLCRVQGFNEHAGRWSQRWYSTQFKTSVQA